VIIIVVDMQNDFANPKGSLYVPSTQEIIPVIKKVIEHAHSHNIPVAFTQDWHREDDRSFKENGGLWKKHCIQNTWGAEIIKEFEVQKQDYIIKKQTYDAFFDTPFDWWLRQKGINELFFCGTVSNICVLESLSGAAKRGYKVGIIKDACAPLSEEGQRILVHQVENVYKGKVVTAKDILSMGG